MLIFFDIDETLMKNHKTISKPVRNMLHQLKENHHTIVICTGRSKSILYHDIQDIPYDALVTSCGCRIETKEEVLINELIHEEELRKLIYDLLQMNVSFNVQGNHSFTHRNDYVFTHIPEENRIIFIERLGAMPPIKEMKEEDYHTTYKVTYQTTDETTAIDVLNNLSDYFHGYYQKRNDFFYTGEITQASYTKGTAITYLSNYFNIPMEETFAIGDSDNDLEMIEMAHIGIAMGNGSKKLKEIANYITDDIDHDGAVTAMQHFHLI